MGGNPFGPAGTGKTESVKALGAQLGRFVLVFNCDESFDYSAMGRLFAGLCQVGRWAACNNLTLIGVLWDTIAAFFCFFGDDSFVHYVTMTIPTVCAFLLHFSLLPVTMMPWP